MRKDKVTLNGIYKGLIRLLYVSNTCIINNNYFIQLQLAQSISSVSVHEVPATILSLNFFDRLTLSGTIIPKIIL